VITEKGKRMPIDPKPVPDGNLFLYRGEDGELHARVEKDSSPTSKRYVSHFATCPNAKKHRKEQR
jgi:hypothetical protein